MTHSDIYTKFMIEYDKANVTSSYPSLTKYEIATILDKAYLALISQKVTGNNSRRVEFENDIKASHDLLKLIDTCSINIKSDLSESNELVFDMSDTVNDLMYFVSAKIDNKLNSVSSTDEIQHSGRQVVLINHKIAYLFKCTVDNLPWIKYPVAYMDNDLIHVFVDPFDLKNINQYILNISYIKKPKMFSELTLLFSNKVEFELSDVITEELINLAILFATEIVESPRQQTKSQLISLES